MEESKLNMLLSDIHLTAMLADKDEEISLDIHGYSGGNLDDAYSLGFEQGRRAFARTLWEFIQR